ncbi:MAG: tryptophan-rich sensory protein [Cyclobacteriaceae bacterium]|jgi:hypothetical protein|nr:tryptophan-rich sensory protein [Cyclobacteriaceae bacterium]
MNDQKNSFTLPVLNTVALTGVLTVNALANILPINGMNTGEVSALYPSLFTPAGITFSIWSVIYLLLTGFVVLQWVQRNDPQITPLLQKISPLFILSSVLNMSWIIAWHHLWVWTSVLIMLGLLATLTVLFLHVQKASSLSTAQQWFIDIAFTVYLAWICVATIANLATALVAVSWDGFGVNPQYWTVAMMVVAAALASYITLHYRKAAFASVVIWALIGILLRAQASEHSLIAVNAAELVLLLVIITVITLVKQQRLS